jgi:hypothetical protein
MSEKGASAKEKASGEAELANKLAQEKKKLKVLKNALKEESAKKEAFEKELKAALERAEVVKQ